MTRRKRARRRREVREALLEANVGCLLLFVILFGAPFVAIGGFFVFMGMATMHEQARLNATAISVPATILTSEVRRTTTTTGPGTGSTQSSYWPDIEFTYEFKGQSRTSNRVWAVEEMGKEATMRRVVARYPTGTSTTAFVDPREPDLAFLEKRWSQMPYIDIVVGILPAAFITGLGVLLAGWRRPGLAALIAALVGAILIFALVLAGNHYLQVLPPDQRAWWMLLLLAGSLAVALSPLVLVRKVRQLHREYREALAAQGDDPGAGSPVASG